MIPAALGAAALLSGWLWAALDRRVTALPRGMLRVAPLALLAGALLTTDPFVLRKLVGRLAMPPAWLWGALYLWSLGALRAGARRTAAGLAALWLLLTLSGNDLLTRAIVRSLEAPYLNLPADTRFDVAYVLGGGSQVGPDARPTLGPSGDRIRQAARLFHDGRAPLLVTAGTAVGGFMQAVPRDLGAETAALWTEMGVPASAIVRLEGPRTTGEEMALLAREAPARGWQRVAVVTSAWHLRRALRHAAHHGLHATPVPADFRGGHPQWTLVSLAPSATSLYVLRLALWEYLATLVSP